MKLVFCIALAASMLGARDQATLARELDAIAKTATVMVDGDVCQRIVTPRALDYILSNPSRDKWAAADNYDVDAAAFITTKKTLMRLALLADYPVDVNLWMPLKPDWSSIHVVIRNKHEMSQFWPWGKLTQEPAPAMLEVRKTGRRITISEKPGFVSVLAPVRNSLGEIVGLVEVVSRVQPDARENVK
jgi:hypothetical protein